MTDEEAEVEDAQHNLTQDTAAEQPWTGINETTTTTDAFASLVEDAYGPIHGSSGYTSLIEEEQLPVELVATAATTTAESKALAAKGKTYSPAVAGSPLGHCVHCKKRMCESQFQHHECDVNPDQPPQWAELAWPLSQSGGKATSVTSTKEKALKAQEKANEELRQSAIKAENKH